MLQRNVLIVTTWTCMFHILKAELGCSPNETLRNVSTCPMSEKEMMGAALRFNCKEVCGDQRYMYHCLPDTTMEHLFEFCAPRVPIIGRRCAEYNLNGNVIQANRYNIRAACGNHSNPCPHVYDSTDAYKYQECFSRPSTNKFPSTPKVKILTVVLIGVSITVFVVNGAILSCLVKIYICKKYKRQRRTQQVEREEENMIPMTQNKHDFEVHV